MTCLCFYDKQMCLFIICMHYVLVLCSVTKVPCTLACILPVLYRIGIGFSGQHI